MSEPTPETTPVEKKPDPKKPTRTRGQKWRRRIIVALATIILCVLATRALVPLLLPTVMRQVASSYGLNAEYDKFDFNLLGGDVGLWNLRITPTDGGEPILTVGYCRASVSTLGLIRGRINVDRAEAEDAEVTVERLADGSIPLLTRFLPPSPTTPVSTATTKPTEIPLEPPLTIRALRLQQAQARLIDRAVRPGTDVRMILNLILSDIGSLEHPTRFSIQLNSPEMLGALYVTGSATARDNLVNADLDLRMVNLNPQPLRAYLAELGVTPSASDVSGQARGKLTMTPADGATTRPAGQPITAVAIKLDLQDLNLTGNSIDVASAKKVLIDIPHASPTEIRVKQVLVDGVKAHAWRNFKGQPGFAFIALGVEPLLEGLEEVATPDATTRPAPAVTPAPDVTGLPFVFELQSLLVRDIKLVFDDVWLPERPQIMLEVSEFSVSKLSTDPKHVDIPAIIDVRAGSPGLAKTIVITGDVSAAKPVKSIRLNADLKGVDPTALDPYLHRMGLTRAMNDATVTANLSGEFEPRADGSIRAGLKLSDVRMADAQGEWFAFSKVDVSDVTVAPYATSVRFGDVAVVGPALNVTRSSTGAVTTLGLTYDPAMKRPESPLLPPPFEFKPTTQPAGRPAMAALSLPVIEIGKLTWSDVGLNVNDAMSSPPVAFGLVEVKLELADLTLDPTAKYAKPGTLRASLVSPTNIERLTVEGTIAPTGEAIAVYLDGSATGMTLAGLRPILNTLGLDPVMNAGTLKFTAGGDMRNQKELLMVNAWVTDMKLADASGEWTALGGLELHGATFDGTTAAIKRLQIDKPLLRVERDEEGKLLAAGIRLIAPTNAPPPPPVDPTLPPVPSRVELVLPVVVKLDEWSVNDAHVSFVDRFVTPSVKIEPRVSVSIKGLVAGAEAEPATLDATVSIPGVIEKLTARGTVQGTPTKLGAQMIVAGEGISGTALQTYLPPGVTPSSKAGTLAATVNAQLAHNPAGGSSIALEAKDVAIADGLRDDPAIKLTAAKLLVDRFDLPGKIIAIKEVSTSGFVARVFQNDQGIVLPFLIIGDAPADVAPAKPAAPAEQALAGEAADIEKLKEAARIKSPLVTIEKLNVGAERLSVQLKSMAYPLAVTNLTLAGENIEMLGDTPHRRPPFDLTVSGSVEKLIDSLQSTATLAPFASEPRAKVSVNVTGIHGNEITTLLPDLAKYIDGKGLSDGKFTSEAEAQFTFVRRGLFGIDMTRDVGVTFSVKNTSLTQAGVEKPLAGVEEVRGEKVRVTPQTGNLNVKSLDIVKPQLHIVRDNEGISAFGMMVKLPANPEPATQPVEEAPAPAEAEPKPAAPQQVADDKPTIDNRADIAINSFTVSGIDLVIEDRVGTPTTVLPISELDLEVKGINTRALREELPIKFSMLAGAGKTPFTKEDGSQTEPREIFAQCSATGQLTLYPNASGYIKSSLNSFEMRAVKGIAQQLGINIGNGTLDFATDIRMKGTDTGVLKLYPSLYDLRLKDSPDGKIQKFMALPMSLDAAIVAVEDADGAISLPVTAPIDAGKLDMGKIVGSAMGAVTNQIMQAVAAAPLKLAAMVGLNFTQEKDLSPVVVPFTPGESLLTPEQDEQIKQMIERLKKDPTLEIALIHTLGSGDFVTSQQRANPTRDDASALGQRLRQRKFDLQKRQVELSATLRVALASQNKILAEQSLNQLQTVSADLMDTEEALDDMLGLLRPGAARQSDRRSKAAAIELGQYRLATVQERFLQSGVKDIAKRVTMGRPTASLENAPEQGNVEIKFARRAKQ